MSPSALLLLLLSCERPDEEEGPQLSEPDPNAPCQLELLDTAIDFGVVKISSAPDWVSVVFRNVGEGDCLIEGLSIVPTDSAFYTEKLRNPLLRAGESGSFDVAFHPEQRGLESAELRVRSKDAERPERRLTLSGEAIAQELSVFLSTEAETPVGCTGSQTLTLANTGELSLQIQAVSLGGEGYDWLEGVPLGFPMLLPADHARTLKLRFEPSAGGLHNGQIQVDSDDPVQPIWVETLVGQGVVLEQVTDRFDQEIRPKTDVVFTFDWSGSIQVHAGIAAQIETMTQTLDAANVDYNIIAVVADDGCPLGGKGPVNATLSGAAQTERFEEQACTNTSSCIFAGANQERALMMMEAAFSATNLGAGGCNEGVFRDEAELHLISLSDEPEQSVDGYEKYLRLFRGLKEDPADVTFHGIGGDMPSGCGNAAAYANYYEAVVATGGAFRSICDYDYIGHMEALGAAVTPDRRSFPLSTWPVTGTLSVEVEGTPLESGWSYDAEANRVVFEENKEPVSGTSFSFHYVEQPECEAL